jgi:hypothetical protein
MLGGADLVENALGGDRVRFHTHDAADGWGEPIGLSSAAEWSRQGRRLVGSGAQGCMAAALRSFLVSARWTSGGQKQGLHTPLHPSCTVWNFDRTSGFYRDEDHRASRRNHPGAVSNFGAQLGRGDKHVRRRARQVQWCMEPPFPRHLDGTTTAPRWNLDGTAGQSRALRQPWVGTSITPPCTATNCRSWSRRDWSSSSPCQRPAP